MESSEHLPTKYLHIPANPEPWRLPIPNYILSSMCRLLVQATHTNLVINYAKSALQTPFSPKGPYIHPSLSQRRRPL